jgi:hypothetical protein
MEALQRQKEEAEQRAMQYEKELASRNRPTNDDDEDDAVDEPYVDHRRLKRKFERFEERTDKKVEEKAAKIAREMFEQEKQVAYLKQNADFSQVLTPDNIKKFAEKYPEVAEPIVEMPDNFARQKLLYQNIKALGVLKPEEKKPSIQDTIDKNRRSPFYQPSGVGAAPYSGGGDFSDAGMKTSYDKIQELKKRIRL